MPTKIEIKRFWDYVKIISIFNCWEWQAGCFDSGYGQYRVGDKKIRAHRYAYELFYGSIPDDLCVCHHCDNVVCVNPLHLFLGTHKDNSQDRERKGRGARNLRPQPGELNGSAKLTWVEVEKIRELQGQGIGYQKLSHLFGICKSQIGNIIKGKSWQIIQK